MSPYIPEYEEGEDLEDFITRVIVPSSANYKRESKAVVHELVKYIHQLPGYSIGEVFKGGSMGKKTSIQKTADIDLIIFFNGYNTVKELKHDKFKILNAIERYLDSSRKPECIQYINFLRKNEYLITFKIQLRHMKNAFEVDMLPAIDIVQNYGADKNYGIIYRTMKAEQKPVREHYSVCFAKLQKALLMKQPEEVIHLIQLLKYCKKKLDLSITSYCCEVLTLFVFSKYYSNGNLNNGFCRVLNLLMRYETLHIVVSDHYKKNKWHIHKEPYILDPVNPYSNTLYLLSREKIDQLKTWAENTLQCYYHKTRFSDTVYVPLIPHNHNEVAITIDPPTYNTPIKSKGTSMWCCIFIIGIVVMLISLLLYLFFKLRKDN